uniref:Uncharacterized protein n=1 Tax=Hyaloperonospora arabidopsidis (strain Emoy2) TaxID=559515 RepID=M4B4T9_HYAAE
MGRLCTHLNSWEGIIGLVRGLNYWLDGAAGANDQDGKANKLPIKAPFDILWVWWAE